MQFFEKLNTELPRDYANPLLGMSERMKTGVQTTFVHMFREVIFTTAMAGNNSDIHQQTNVYNKGGPVLRAMEHSSIKVKG